MKKLFLIVGLLVLVFPVIALAHGDEVDDEHHMSDMMGETTEATQHNEDSAIEPCIVGSVIECGGDHSEISLDDAVGQLLSGLKVANLADIDCNNIVDHDFEHVGEALMSYMHPDQAEHERIDQMMGGEGSESLESMHTFMGKRYLGCDEGALGAMMMMGGDRGIIGMHGGMSGLAAFPFSMMFGGQSNLYRSMMGGGFYWFGLGQLIVWILAIVGVIWLVGLITDKGNK